MRTKIIAEIGYNHNGSIEIAKKLIDSVKKLSLWAVKFQKWDIDNFPESIKNRVRNSPNDYGLTYYEHRKYLEFSLDQLKELKKYANELGLQFICSGKDLKSIKQLVEQLNLKYIKIPSQRYYDNQIFKYLYNQRKLKRFKIMASTGMLNGNQIKKSRWKDRDGADVLMHCVSLYPAKLRECNLAWMLNVDYNGYSSHEDQGTAIKYAVCMGAEIIERHFTFDKNEKGSDHAISSDEKEMKRIIKEIKEVEEILGNGKRNLTDKEIELGKYYRSF